MSLFAQLFGMHDNADISRELNETTQLTESLLLTQQGSATASLTTLSSTETTESALHDICERILSQIPAEYNVTLAMERYPVCYQESMNTVLVQELIRYNRLIAVIRRTLCDVQRAQKGLILMSSELEDVTRTKCERGRYNNSLSGCSLGVGRALTVDRQDSTELGETVLSESEAIGRVCGGFARQAVLPSSKRAAHHEKVA